MLSKSNWPICTGNTANRRALSHRLPPPELSVCVLLPESTDHDRCSHAGRRVRSSRSLPSKRRCTCNREPGNVALPSPVSFHWSSISPPHGSSANGNDTSTSAEASPGRASLRTSAMRGFFASRGRHSSQALLSSSSSFSVGDGETGSFGKRRAPRASRLRAKSADLVTS